MTRRPGTRESSAAARAWIAAATALAALAPLVSCGGSRAAVSDTARRVALTLEVGREEHSKDSHERRAVLELRDGVLTARRSWSGYWGGWDPPPPETVRVELGDVELEKIIRAIESSGVERASAAETGRLDGPGDVEMLDLALTLDGRRSRVRSVHRRSWRGGAPAGPAHAALQGLASGLEALAPSRVER